MSDGNGGSATTTVNVTVALVNDAPVSRHDVFTAVVNQTTAVGGKGVLANDDDIADDANGIYPLSVTAPTTIVVSDPAKGSVAVNADGSFTYTSTSSALGSNTFSYRAVDRDGGLSNVASSRSISCSSRCRTRPRPATRWQPVRSSAPAIRCRAR